MKLKNKQSIIVLAILASLLLPLATTFVLPNFALAQEKPEAAPPDPTPKITAPIPGTKVTAEAKGTCFNMLVQPPYPNGIDPQSSQEVCESDAVKGLWYKASSPSKGNVKLTPESEKAAQDSPEACKKFSGEVANVFDNAFKAVYFAKAVYRNPWDKISTTKKGCYIVSSNTHVGKDGISADNPGFTQPLGTQVIQTKIKNGSGVSKEQIDISKRLADEEMKKASTFSQFIGKVLQGLIGVVTNAVGAITAMVGGIFVATVSEITKVQSLPPVVDVGWTVVRDIANMFFILILIVISFGTILRFEEYDYKHLLREVIIMALLVNFSKEIALALMNFVTVIMKMFSIDGSIVDIFIWHIGFIRSFQEGLPNGALAGLADALAQLGFALTSLFVFVVLCAMFVIRLVGIYVLIVLSPMAYVLNIIPQTKNYAQEWWKHFIKYLIWAPVALFFIKLAALAADGGLGDIGDPSNSAFRYVILCGFMLAAVMVAKQAGMVGANEMMSLGKKYGMKAGKFALGAADRWLAKGAKSTAPGWRGKARRAGSYFSVGAWQKGYKQYMEEEEHRAYGELAGKRADTLYRRLPWQREKTSFGLEAHQSEVQRRAKEKLELNLSERETVDEMLGAKDLTDKQGWGLSMVSQNRQDDFLRILKEKLIVNGKLDEQALAKTNLAKEFTNPLTGKVEKLEDILKDGKITPTNFQKVFYGMYLGNMAEKDKVGYASMVQEYAEKQNKPYHLADKIEVETTDAQGKKHVESKVNYGFAELRTKTGELEEQAKTRQLDLGEQKQLSYYKAVVGQFKSRMDRTPANKFMNGMRAADIDVQFADSESAAKADFSGESYGDIHDQGVIMNEIFGLPHATQIKNRQHELQSRGVIPFGAKGEDVAADKYSLRRAASSAATNPTVMDVFLRERPVQVKIDVFTAAIQRASELGVPKENIHKLWDLVAKYEHKRAHPEEE